VNITEKRMSKVLQRYIEENNYDATKYLSSNNVYICTTIYPGMCNDKQRAN